MVNPHGIAINQHKSVAHALSEKTNREMDGHEKGSIAQIDGNVKTQWVSLVASFLTKDFKSINVITLGR